MPTTLARRRPTALFASVALLAVLSIFTTRRAEAEPAKHGAATARVLAQEASRPTPGVDAPKVAPRAHAHHATAKAKAARAAKPVKVKGVKAKHGAPKPARERAPGAKPGGAKLSAKA